MKKIGMIFAAILISTASFAGGFDCKELGVKLDLQQAPTGEWYFGNPRVVVPMGQDVGTYQERWFVYHYLIEQATLRFPYMPGTLQVFHVLRSNKQFRTGFKEVDNLQSTKYVKLSKMYCKALIKVLQEI